uniref:NADAR domain-containing protein n=1 Tax=Globodera rostochiensis TaxID=31243 RepID=A0A914GV48_GLORO
MSTPATVKKLEEKKQLAQKRKEKQHQMQQKDGDTAGAQLLSLSAQSDAPSSHLLVRTEPVEGAPPRHIDLRPLSGAYSNYRERKEDFSTDDNGSAARYAWPPFNYQPTFAPPPPLQQQQNVLQPLSRPSSFNNYRRPQSARFGGKLKQQTFMPLADGAQCWEITVRADKIVCFYGKTNFLSQLSPVALVVDGNEYGSLEHYYQACKLFSLIGAQAAQELRSVKDPLKAKTRTRELLFAVGVNKAKVDAWKNTHGVLVLQHAMRLKFGVQHPEMRDQLLATEDALLIQAYDKDSFFAAGMTESAAREWAKENEGNVLKFPSELNHENVKHIPLIGKGKNVLGVLAMHIRNELRNKKSSPDDIQAYDEFKQREEQLSPGLGHALSCLDISDAEDVDENASSSNGDTDTDGNAEKN